MRDRKTTKIQGTDKAKKKRAQKITRTSAGGVTQKIRKQKEVCFLDLAGVKIHADTILENVGYGIAIIDRNYRVLYRNNACKDFIKSNTGTFCYQLFEKKKSVCENCPLEKTFRDGKIRSTEESFTTGRDILHFEIKTSPLKDATGKIIAGVKFIRDVTAQKRTEHALVESEAELRTAIDSLPFDVFGIDREGRYFIQNSYCRKRWGNLIGKRPEEVNVDKKTLALWLDNNRRAFSGGTIKEEVTFPVKDEGRYFYNVISPIREHDHIIGILGINIDITEQKMAREARSQTEARFRILADKSPSMIFINHKGRVVYVNEKCREIMGYSKKEFLSPDFDFLTLIAPESLDRVRENFSRHMKGKGVPPHEYNLVTKTGKKLHTLIHTKLIDYRGERAILGIVTDVTERKKIEEALTSERNKLQALLDGLALTGIGVDIIKTDYRILYQNRNLKERFGNLTGKLCYEEYMGRREPCDFCPMVGALKNNTAERAEVTGKDGRTYEILAAPLVSNEGAEAIAIEVIQDITDRTVAERALKESERKYRDLYDNAPDMYHSLDKNGIIIDCNETEARMLGYKKEEMIGRHLTDFYTEESVRGFQRDFPFVNKNIMQFTVEREFVRKNGSTIPISMNVYTEFDERGNVFRTRAIARDISERKKAERVLQQSEDKYGNLFLHSSDQIFLNDLEGNIIDVNQKALEQFGYTKPEILDLNIAELYSEESMAVAKDAFEKIVKEGTVHFEIVFKKKSGEHFTGEVSSNIIEVEGRRLIQGIVRDITDRNRMLEALRESEEKYRTLFENSKDTIFIINRDGRIIEINQSGIELFGFTRTEIADVNFKALYVNPEEWKEFFAEMARSGSVKDYEVRLQKKDGTALTCLITSNQWITSDGTILGYEGVIRDITDIRAIEEDLLQMEKLESIGMLAGGIAHDFNNILTTILGNITLASMYSTPGGELAERLKEAEIATLRARNLTRQLLTFSRGGAPARKVTSIIPLLKDSTSFALRNSDITVKYSLPEDLWYVNIDEGQISQVVHNLVINADQAMRGNGTLEIVAENTVVKRVDDLHIRGGKYVRIVFAGHGTGMSREDIQKTFEPFFTTKSEGSGLGLAVIYSVIKKHEGHIEVKSEPAVGTTFTFYLPASDESLVAVTGKDERPLIGKGRILLMDDEDTIREVAGEMLRQIGYEAGFAKDGMEAIDVYTKAKASGQPFDAVIMDLTIPGGMGGLEAIKKLIEIDPELRAIVSSGYSDDPVMARFTEYGFRGFIPKPYKLIDLSKVLYAVLSESG